MDAPILFDGVWKKFKLGESHNSLRDLVPAMFKRAFTPQPPENELQTQEFWALKDVSFAVQPGEALGIIGPNGAGKSTTLKLLTRILRPTSGVSRVKGRVGALIEIAAGFHGDLTGRENIYLQGAIMGMKRAEITKKLDAIIDFASMDEFIDTQAKRYSSGMNARLGFAIAANLEPDVLIIDEVLSVGDMAFQRKCIERMERFKQDGVAIAFVSHNLQAIDQLCDKALYLNHAVVAHGKTQDVLTKYVESSGLQTTETPDTQVKLVAAELLRNGAPAHDVEPGQRLTLRLTYQPSESFTDVTFSLVALRSSDQLFVYHGMFGMDEVGQRLIREGEAFSIEYQFQVNLTRGHYYLEAQIYNNLTQRFVSRVSPVANISVAETRTYAGVADLGVVAGPANGTKAAPVAAGVGGLA